MLLGPAGSAPFDHVTITVTVYGLDVMLSFVMYVAQLTLRWPEVTGVELLCGMIHGTVVPTATVLEVIAAPAQLSKRYVPVQFTILLSPVRSVDESPRVIVL